MTLQDLGSLGEFIGAIAVVVSLVYLAFQIRQNTRALRGSTYQGIVDTVNDLGSTFTRTPGFSRIFIAGSQSLERLDPEERLSFQAHFVGLYRAYENMFYQNQQGALDPKLWSGWVRDIEFFIRLPGISALWPQVQNRYSLDFQLTTNGWAFLGLVVFWRRGAVPQR